MIKITQYKRLSLTLMIETKSNQILDLFQFLKKSLLMYQVLLYKSTEKPMSQNRLSMLRFELKDKWMEDGNCLKSI